MTEKPLERWKEEFRELYSDARARLQASTYAGNAFASNENRTHLARVEGSLDALEHIISLDDGQRTIAEILFDDNLTNSGLRTVHDYSLNLLKEAEASTALLGKDNERYERLYAGGRLLFNLTNALSYDRTQRLIVDGNLHTHAGNWHNYASREYLPQSIRDIFVAAHNVYFYRSVSLSQKPVPRSAQPEFVEALRQ